MPEPRQGNPEALLGIITGQLNDQQQAMNHAIERLTQLGYRVNKPER